ncbi:hypothetical protein E1218_26790 [Kribbella turkmenica]|uniref:Uncharacterized protein n=1 Tax=Kribbella turkmenica TaxID=2530375 RepID=A0A4R4WFV8_9ACTN|nr:hypothetical protein [Kribbella turkmenica]TDD17988.1 hypothetical protein E1218_26790 [Kribbella turkmenica]
MEQPGKHQRARTEQQMMIPSEVVESVDRPYPELAAQVLKEWFGVSAAQADVLIADWARNCQRSPNTVAQVLVRQIWQGTDTTVDPVVARTLEGALRNLPHVVAVGMDSGMAIPARGAG